MRTLWISLVAASVAAGGAALAQTPDGALRSPARPAKARPAATQARTSQPAAKSQAVDPYEKARKAQADYFKRQAEEQEKAKLKESSESRFYKNAPDTPSGGSGLQIPAFKF